MRALALLGLVAACGGGSTPRAEAPPPAPASACIADRVPDPVPEQDRIVVCEGAERSCRTWCESGRAGACMALAYIAEKDDVTRLEAVQLYGRACELGLLIGCTNHGAYLLDGGPGIELETDPACAVRLHQLACDGGETWGCGMLGYELARGTGIDRDLVRARTVLETACAELRSFSCAVLGDLLEQGSFGDLYKDEAAAAYRAACESGYEDSCADADRLAPPR